MRLIMHSCSASLGEPDAGPAGADPVANDDKLSPTRPSPRPPLSPISTNVDRVVRPHDSYPIPQGPEARSQSTHAAPAWSLIPYGPRPITCREFDSRVDTLRYHETKFRGFVEAYERKRDSLIEKAALIEKREAKLYTREIDVEEREAMAQRMYAEYKAQRNLFQASMAEYQRLQTALRVREAATDRRHAELKEMRKQVARQMVEVETRGTQLQQQETALHIHRKRHESVVAEWNMHFARFVATIHAGVGGVVDGYADADAVEEQI